MEVFLAELEERHKDENLFWFWMELGGTAPIRGLLLRRTSDWCFFFPTLLLSGIESGRALLGVVEGEVFPQNSLR